MAWWGLTCDHMGLPEVLQKARGREVFGAGVGISPLLPTHQLGGWAWALGI